MTDEELTAFMHITPEEAAIVLPKLSPVRRRLFDRMQTVVRLSKNIIGIEIINK